MRRTITVLQDDIDNGRPVSARDCPIARAIRRDLADLAQPGTVTVTRGHLTIGVYVVHTPQAADQFIRQFDRHQPVEPFKFEIEVDE